MLTFCFIITWWRYQIETFSALLALCGSPVIGEFPTQRPATRSFDVFFDLKRHHTHYVVTGMNTWWNFVMHLSVFSLYAWLALVAYYDDTNANDAKQASVGKISLFQLYDFSLNIWTELCLFCCRYIANCRCVHDVYLLISARVFPQPVSHQPNQVKLLWPGDTPGSKVHGANMRPIWGRQDPGGPHVGPMNFVIWDHMPT